MSAVDFPIVDADGHVFEDPDRLQELTDRQYRSLAPQFVPQRDTKLLMYGGHYLPLPQDFNWGGLFTPGARDESYGRRIEAVDLSVARSPEARLAMMDDYGIHASVLVPSFGLMTHFVDHDPRAHAAVARGINRYMSEFASADNDRLFWVGPIPVTDVDLACKEARHAVSELGASGLIVPPGMFPRPIYDQMYEPLWDTMAELGAPLLTHNGAPLVHPRHGLPAERFPGRWAPFHIAAHSIEAQLACLGVITAGWLERHPGLRVGFFEAGTAWVQGILHAIDDKREMVAWMMPEMERSAEEVFRAQCVVTVEAGEEGVTSLAEALDGRGIVWASDVPHFDAEDGGRPRKVVEHEGLSDEHKRRILSDNVVEFFGLKLKTKAKAKATTA